MALFENIFGPASSGTRDFFGNALSDLGYGLAQGKNVGQALGVATARSQDMQPQRDAYATAQKAEADRQKQLNQTIQFLQQKYPDLAQEVANGMSIGDAYNEANRRSTPGYGDPSYGKPPVDPTSTASGRQQLGKDNGLTGDALHMYVLTGKLPEAAKPKDAPNGYQWGADGTLAFIAGGPADPSTAGKTTEATRRNQQLATVIDPEVQSLMGDGTAANPGTFDALANGWDQAKAGGGDIGRMLGQGPSPEYQQAQNSLKTIIASYLYSVSGATANPGEVETQASVLTPKMGESKEAVAAKKARIVQMVEAVKAAATGKPINIDNPTNGSSGDPELDRALQQYGN